MDRREAIEILAGRYLIAVDTDNETAKEHVRMVNEALDLAIEALSEPTGDYEFFGGEYAKEGDAESATTTDCISRADTIKVMCAECVYEGDCDRECTEVAIVKGMPPVKLKSPCDSLLESDSGEFKEQKSKLDCISRQAAIEAFCYDCRKLKPGQCEHWYSCRSQKELRSLPPVTPKEQTDCTDFINWLLEEVLDEENWELNAVANGEIICRKLKKLDLLEVKDGYYVRASVTPTERTGEWVVEHSGNGWNEWTNYTCSECNEKFNKFYASIYCPNCGAKMGGDTE